MDERSIGMEKGRVLFLRFEELFADNGRLSDPSHGTVTTALQNRCQEPDRSASSKMTRYKRRDNAHALLCCC